MRRVPIAPMLAVGTLLAMAACGRSVGIGQSPDFTPTREGREAYAMRVPDMPADAPGTGTGVVAASLWTQDTGSLLGDRRAGAQGDILTVVIEIDESASIDNATERSRNADEQLAIPDLFGLPERVAGQLPDGATLDSAVGIDSASDFSGDGSVQRAERLTLRIAAVVVDVLPNGALQIAGSQEVRVNFELRELLVEGYVRPADISRQNEITYDRIAAARISYGGRGQITDVQQPRYGQQIADAILPF